MQRRLLQALFQLCVVFFIVDVEINVDVDPQTTLKTFKKVDFQTVREHDEFVWLHDRYVENEDYAGIIVSGCMSPDM